MKPLRVLVILRGSNCWDAESSTSLLFYGYLSMMIYESEFGVKMLILSLLWLTLSFANNLVLSMCRYVGSIRIQKSWAVGFSHLRLRKMMIRQWSSQMQKVWEVYMLSVMVIIDSNWFSALCFDTINNTIFMKVTVLSKDWQFVAFMASHLRIS